MTKTDLVNVVAAQTEVSKKVVETVINNTLEAISNALKDGDKVQIIGFGTFEVKETSEKMGRNHQTGEAIKIDASKRVSFGASKVLKDNVNG